MKIQVNNLIMMYSRISAEIREKITTETRPEKLQFNKVYLRELEQAIADLKRSQHKPKNDTSRTRYTGEWK